MNVYLKELDCLVENLQLLTHNRERENIILLTSKPPSIMTAFAQGFNCIPILPYQGSNVHDYQLTLVENYIMKNNKNLTKVIKPDFGFLKVN